MIIYKATNKINGMSYVGQTICSLDRRKNGHINDALANRDNIYFHSALKKYGVDNFDWDIIDKADNIDELNRLEIFYIGHYKTYFEGYNLTMGGKNSVGYIMPKEQKQKISKSLKDKKRGPHAEKTRKKMSENHWDSSGSNNPAVRPIILIHEDGKEEYFEYMKLACDKYNLGASHLSAVAQGKYKQIKGFKCRYIDKEIL
jgi:group I intron endonuclease